MTLDVQMPFYELIETEVIFCRSWVLLLKNNQKKFIYFLLERPGKLILDGTHNESKIKEGFRGELIRWRLQLWNSEK